MFKTVIPLALSALGASLLIASPAQAQSMRCRNDLANVGDNKAAVLHKCGEPVQRDAYCKPQPPVHSTHTGPSSASSTTVVNVVPCEQVEEWTYNPGRGQFMTTLRFESGKLAAITYGDRVK